MKNKSEIGYFTILGLSLSVVLTAYKDFKVLKFSLPANSIIVTANQLKSPTHPFTAFINNPPFFNGEETCFIFSGNYSYSITNSCPSTCYSDLRYTLINHKGLNTCSIELSAFSVASSNIIVFYNNLLLRNPVFCQDIFTWVKNSPYLKGVSFDDTLWCNKIFNYTNHKAIKTAELIKSSNLSRAGPCIG